MNQRRCLGGSPGRPRSPRDHLGVSSIDPGIGRDVVNWLTASKLGGIPGIIVHSSNPEGAFGMVFALQAAGIRVTRVLPKDDLNWITSAWAAAVQALSR